MTSRDQRLLLISGRDLGWLRRLHQHPKQTVCTSRLCRAVADMASNWTQAAEEFRNCAERFASSRKIASEAGTSDWGTECWDVLASALKQVRGSGPPDSSTSLLLDLPGLVGTCARHAIEYTDRYGAQLQTITDVVTLAAEVFKPETEVVPLALQTSLARQCANSEVLLSLMSSLDEVAEEQMQAGTASDSATASAIVSKIRQQKRLEHATAQLQLFHVLNSIWPGDAGVLTYSKSMGAGSAASCCAGIVYGAVAVAHQQSQAATAVGLHALQTALIAVLLIAKQLHNRPALLSDRKLVGQMFTLMSSKGFLHMLMLVVDMQLHQVLQLPAANSVIRRSYRPYHKQTLKSFGQMPDWLWAAGQQQVAASSVQPLWTLEVLTLLLVRQQDIYRIRHKQSKPDKQYYHESRASWEHAVFSPLAALIPALLTAAAGVDLQEQQPLVAAALEAAAAAAHVITGVLRVGSHNRALLETVTVTELSQLQPPMLLLLKQFLAAWKDNPIGPPHADSIIENSLAECEAEGFSSSSRAASSSNNNNTIHQPAVFLIPILEVLSSVLAAIKTAAHMTQQQAVELVWQQQLQPLIPVLEHSIRIAASSPGIATAKSRDSIAFITLTQELTSSIGCLLVASSTAQGAKDAFELKNKYVFFSSYGSASPAARTDSAAAAADKQFPTASSAAAVAAASSRTVKDSSSVGSAAQNKQLIALLLTCLKVSSSSAVAPAVAVLACTALANIAALQPAGESSAPPVQQAGQQQEPLEQLARSLPWLLLLARCLQPLAVENCRDWGINCSDSSADMDEEYRECRESFDHLVESESFTELFVYSLFSKTLACCKQLISAQANESSSVQDAAAEAATAVSDGTQAAAVLAVVLQGLHGLVQQWEQGLNTKVQDAENIVNKLLRRLHDNKAPPGQQHRPVDESLRKEVLAVFSGHHQPLPFSGEAIALATDLLLAANSACTRRQLLSKSFVGQLPQQLQEAGNQLCAVLPVALCCNNPMCSNLSGSSELSIVRVKGSVCSGCGEARYCGRQCQTAHWPAHRRLCKLIKRQTFASDAA